MRSYGIDRSYQGTAPPFVSVNAGKRSIVSLDLKSESGRDAARRLIGDARDVVIENFRPGVMAWPGLGYEDCRKIKPDIIFCSISGFGQSGPLKGYPAIDQIIQSASGLMSSRANREARRCASASCGRHVQRLACGLCGRFSAAATRAFRRRSIYRPRHARRLDADDDLGARPLSRQWPEAGEAG